MTPPAEHTESVKSARRVRWSLNPLARKRWQRFRRHRRGFWSLAAVAAMYVFSLGSELICNDKPLFVRFDGASYFPVFRFYPDDLFTGSGLQTRPDYKAIEASPAFAAGGDNVMIFPPFRYGPYEIVNPASLRAHERVEVAVRARQRVASVHVDRDLAITRGQGAEVFLGDPLPARLEDVWKVPEALREAVALRLDNRSAPELTLSLPAQDKAPGTELLLRAYEPRRSAPRDVRLSLRETETADVERHDLAFLRDGTPDRPDHPFWRTLDPDAREIIGQGIADSLSGRPADLAFRSGGKDYVGTARFSEISWPYRPVPGHWMGIDNAGRDVWARILYGLRTSMTFGLLLVAVSMSLGVAMGALQGFYGGKVDLVGQRFIEIWSTIPFLYVMILLGSMYGRSFSLLLFCYALFNWIGISYYVRAEFLRLRGAAFVDAARCLGISPGRIMFRHILPNALTPIITFVPFSLVGAIGSLAVLDFLGFGLPPPTPSWGELLQQAQAFRWAWWLILYPSAALFVVILLVVFIGEGVRDAYDPKPLTRME